MRGLKRNSLHGFTLLEVLIAVLVFSIGLLGVAGMVLASMRGTHTAQLHTQAIVQAQWIGDAMRANQTGVMDGNYDIDPAPSTGSANCDAGCSAAQAATRDLQRWGSQLAQALPAGRGSINCELNPPQREGRDAFPAGLCTIRITWSESDETHAIDASNAAAVVERKTQRFDWVINP
jgi:type IV pilus assembly protein PilV